MFVDLYAVPLNDPKILCGRGSYPVFHFFNLSKRLGRCCVELPYGITLSRLSLPINVHVWRRKLWIVQRMTLTVTLKMTMKKAAVQMKSKMLAGMWTKRSELSYKLLLARQWLTWIKRFVYCVRPRVVLFSKQNEKVMARHFANILQNEWRQEWLDGLFISLKEEEPKWLIHR